MLGDNVLALAIQKRWWLPLDRRLAIDVMDSADGALVGTRLCGVVRGYDTTERGVLTRLLIELDPPFSIPSTAPRQVEWLVTVPDGHSSTSSLCFGGSVVVKMVEASSFVDCLDRMPIATARLQLWS